MDGLEICRHSNVWYFRDMSEFEMYSKTFCKSSDMSGWDGEAE